MAASAPDLARIAPRTLSRIMSTLCGGAMQIIAFVTEAPAIHAILTREPTTTAEVAPARGPPLPEQAAQFHWDDNPSTRA